MNKKMTGITKRGNSYSFTVSMGRDGNYKSIRKYMTFVPPEDVSPERADILAQEEYAKFKLACRGQASLKENMRFRDLCDTYFAVYAPNALKEQTVYNYRITVENHLLPKFGNMKLREISTAMISEYLTSVPVAPDTSRKFKTTLQSIFNFAVTQGLVQTNPCTGALYKKKTEDKLNYLTVAQSRQLLSKLEDYSQFHTIIKLLMFTGMRSGECLGLRWSSIDFNENVIKIDKTLVYANNHWYLDSPKTRCSARSIMIDEETAEMLKQHKGEQEKIKTAFGDGWKQPEMVFTSCTGNWYDRSLLNTQFRRFVKKQTEIPYITVHGLRHSFVALMLYSEESFEVISKHLGHTSLDITSRMYSHIVDEVKVRVTKSVARALRGA